MQLKAQAQKPPMKKIFGDIFLWNIPANVRHMCTQGATTPIRYYRFYQHCFTLCNKRTYTANGKHAYKPQHCRSYRIH